MREIGWDAEKGDFKPEEHEYIKGILTRDAAQRSLEASRPPTPDAYDAKLPADFKVPQGLEYKIDPTSPLMAQARALAHEAGMSQPMFEKMIGLHAAITVNNEQTITSARNAEIGKLGPAGPARVGAIDDFYRAVYGEADAKIKMARLLTADDVRIAEKEIARATSQGAGSFSQAHRQPNEPARVSPEQYAKMTYSEKKDYAAQFEKTGARPN